MFGVLLRAAVTFVVAPILIYIWIQGMGPLISLLETTGAEQSRHAYYLETTAEWLALIVLLSLIIWVIAAAVQYRRGTGV